MSASILKSYSSQWRYKSLLLAHILIALGVVTLFSPLTEGFWKAIDMFWYKTLNNTLNWGRPWQVFWALANHKLADWVEDVVIIIFCVLYVKGGSKEQRLYRTSQVLFLILYSALIIFFVNKTIFREWVDIVRESPTHVVNTGIKLSDHISWLKIKDGSSKSFPGDHATTALIFGATFVYLGSKKMKILAAIYAVFLCLPRMILGAHWLTDVMIGSGSIVCFFLAWAFCTPMAQNATKALERFLSLFSKKAKAVTI